MGVPNRVAEGLIHLFDGKLGLSQHFLYKIEGGYDKKSVDRILDMVFQLTNEPIRELEKVFSVDGSGSPTSVIQNYARVAKVSVETKIKINMRKQNGYFGFFDLRP